MYKVEIATRDGKPHFERFSFQRTIDDLEHAVQWIQSLGRKVSPTRIGRYRRDIRWANDQLVSGKLESFFRHAGDADKANAFAAILTSLYEIGEFISIYNGLKTLSASVERYKLRDLLSGPVSYVDEGSGSAAARNTAFELIVAARLGEIGLLPALVPPADILVPIRQARLVFECKRPQTLSSLLGNVEDAFRQLKKRYQTTHYPRLRGIAALDVTKVANPGFGRLRSNSLSDLDKQLGDALEEFARRHVRGWTLSASEKTIGVLLRVSMLADLQDSRLPVYAQQYLLVSIARPGSRDQAVTHELYDLLSRPPVWKTQGAS